MAPIEVLFGMLVLVLALIGLVRGFLRELGVTSMMMLALLALHLLEPLLDQGLARLLSSETEVAASSTALAGQTWFFVAVILGTAFVAYAGEALAFHGERIAGVPGLALGLITGSLNGYLIAGSVWYYLDKWDYALSFLRLPAEGLSEMAQTMVAYLPLNFLGQPVLLGQSTLLYLAALLVVGRVIVR